jgi:ABC-2 type transport system ATP-binding protein
MQVKRNVGWVAAEVILDDDFSGWENLWLQAKLQRLDDWKGRAESLLTYFQLTDRRKDKVSTYSTGMRKKLEIALALLHQPQVIFMDEPTIGLDPNTRRMLWELIEGVHTEFGISVLLTSHYIEEADRLCDRVSIIDHGKFVASGTPNELKSKVQADIIEIETANSVDEARLRAIPGVSEVRTQGKTWVLRVASAEEVLPRILAALKDDGIRRVNVEKPSLETVFLDVTGHRLGESTGEATDYRKFYAQMRRARQ